MIVLVDSDILIEVTRGRDETLLQRWMELAASDEPVLYSPVSEAELWAGARPREHDVLLRLFRALTCVVIDAESGRQAGDFLRRYHKSHGSGTRRRADRRCGAAQPCRPVDQKSQALPDERTGVLLALARPCTR